MNTRLRRHVAHCQRQIERNGICGHPFGLLRNRLYRGEIEHRGEVHQGEHQAIVGVKLGEEVQLRLGDQSQRHRDIGSREDSPPLAGLIARVTG